MGALRGSDHGRLRFDSPALTRLINGSRPDGVDSARRVRNRLSWTKSISTQILFQFESGPFWMQVDST